MQSILMTVGIFLLVAAAALGGLSAYVYRAWRIRDILDDLSGKTRMSGIETLRTSRQTRNARANRKGRAKALDIEAVSAAKSDTAATNKFETGEPYSGKIAEPFSLTGKDAKREKPSSNDRNAGTIFIRDVKEKTPPKGVGFRLVRSEIAVNSDAVIGQQ